MRTDTTPDYYAIGDFEASDVIMMLDSLDGYETWAIGDALAYLIRAGRKTPDPTEDLQKARNSILKALNYRRVRMMPHD